MEIESIDLFQLEKLMNTKRKDMEMKRRLNNIKMYLKSRKGLSEILQVIVIIGLVALIAVNTLPGIATTLRTRATDTNTKLTAIDNIYN